PIGNPSRHVQDARLVGTDPDPNSVCRSGASFGALDLVVGAARPHSPGPVRGPDLAHDLDRFFQGLDRLARCQAPAAHRLNGIPESTCPDAQFKTTAGEQIETGRAASEHSGLPQWQIEDIATDVDLPRA